MGLLLASGSSDITVRVWEAASGKLVQTLNGKRSEVHRNPFSEDGKLLASGSSDQTVQVWEAATGMLLRTLSGHQGQVQSVAWSEDGKLLASGSTDQTVRVWDAASGKLLHTLNGHENWVQSVAWSGDGKLLASGSSDITVRVWAAGSGKLVQTLNGHIREVQSVAWSSDGKLLASGSTDQTVRVWDAASGKLVRTFSGHQGQVLSVAWSEDEKMLVSGSDDQTVRVWEAASGKLLHTLEGLKGSVASVAFSPDDTLVSGGTRKEKRVMVWSVKTGVALKTYDSDLPAHALQEVAFAAAIPTAAAFGQTPYGETDIDVSAYQMSDEAADSPPPIESIVSAKIVLMGDSGAGKTCLELQLTEGRYEELGSTHAMRLRQIAPERLHPAMAAPAGEQRELVIWDLGGQAEYRLVHQLFLNDTTMALLLFDPTRDNHFDDVAEWNLRLEKQLHGQPVTKLLVGTKSDQWTEGMVDHGRIAQLRNECQFVSFYPISAMKGHGLDELRAAIAAQLDWSALSRTSSPELFQRIRKLIAERQAQQQPVMLYAELLKELGSTDAEAKTCNQVVEQLAKQGLIVDRRMASGERALVLHIGLVELYAGSLILEVRNRTRNAAQRIPALEIADALGLKSYPGIKDSDRLPLFQERIVLECVIQLLLEHGVCLKHEGLLIFPTFFAESGYKANEQAAHTVSLYYDFAGAIDNIYSSLVVRLALSKRFGRVRLWKDRAEYEEAGGIAGSGVCGLRRVDKRGGWSHLDLLFSERTTPATRGLFTAFVEEHLRNQGVEIEEVQEVTCTCGYRFEPQLIGEYVDAQRLEIKCPRPDCERMNPITRSAAQTRASDSNAERELLALKTNIKLRMKKDSKDAKSVAETVEVFFSYAHKDEDLRDQLAEHLAGLRRQGVIREWHDRKILPGEQWADIIDERLNTADIILLLVSPAFLNSDYCYDNEMKRAIERHNEGSAVVVPVIARPCDWQGSQFSHLQALPKDAKPVTSWTNRDEAWLDVAAGLRRTVTELLKPPSERQPVARIADAAAPAQLVEPEPITILHLSDLHFGKGDDPQVRLQPLVRDLRDREGGLGFNELDYLVLSGDLTNTGSAEEFELAYQFISALIERFKLSAARVIITPGNHDLSWEREVYDWKQERRVDARALRAGAYVKQGDGFLIRKEADYAQRFENFARFYHQLTQQEYPLNAAQQGFSYLYTEPRLQFLSFNSAWEIDEFFRDRASIQGSALADGLLRAEKEITLAKEQKRLATDAEVMRIAVWHHPITGNEKIAADAFLDQLRQENVRMILHGHVHEDRADVVRYTDPRKIYVAGAGSYGAGKVERPESTPKLYNLIQVARNHAWAKVHTRCLRKEGGAWEGWAVWPDEEVGRKRMYYEIRFD